MQFAQPVPPDGYKLDRSAGYYKGQYQYRTSVFSGIVLNNDTGQIVARIDHQWEENIDPNYNQWHFEVKFVHIFGPEANYHTSYGCGVSLEDESDPTCHDYPGNGSVDANQGIYGEVQPGDSTSDPSDYGFGTATVRKFPYVNVQLEWPTLNYAHNINDDGRWGSYWRGWDTCQESSPIDTRLCTTSGDGS